MSKQQTTSGSKRCDEIFAQDFREQPYWWRAASPTTDAATRRTPEKAEVVIVGGGITGLVAALNLARGGAEVVIVDSQDIGEGAARRSAGFLGRTLKRSVAWISSRDGSEHAVKVYRELDAALKGVATVVEEEDIDCYHTICGRMVSANSPAHLRGLISDLESMKRHLGFDYSVVEKHEMHKEIASDRFHGGAIIPDLGSIHPGLYHAGLLKKVIETGVQLFDHTSVTGIDDDQAEKLVRTTRGNIRARHVVVATNGYTSKDLSWHARRVIPFKGFVVATDILPKDLLEKVLPKRRTYLDTKMNIDFIRPAPDSDRIIFGGMTGTNCDTGTGLASALYGRMITILPDLRGVKLSHAWTGNCAGTFDFMPHLGLKQGVHYALGYNFAGIPLGTSFGKIVAARILGRGNQSSVFDVAKFPSVPLYRGSPWFVPLAMKYFDWHDRRIANHR